MTKEMFVEKYRLTACRDEALADLDALLQAVQKDYMELIYAVSRKHPGESRHQTALRYIQQAERPNNEPAAAIRAGKEGA